VPISHSGLALVPTRVRLRKRCLKARRRGVTLRDTIVGFVVVLILAALLFPLFVMFRDRARRMDCQGKLRNVGLAIGKYRQLSPQRTYPIGAGYSQQTASSGISWWVEILPHADTESPVKNWNRGIKDSGDFTKPTANENAKIADGLQLSMFYCPSSPLPLFADPARYMSEANVRSLGRDAKGVPIPMFVAIAGSAPDAAGYDEMPNKTFPSGKNTKDDKYGILSGSGPFPPNLPLQDAALSDQPKNRIILVGEQSDYIRDESLDPADEYDPRSAWPRGAFMGTAGDYKDVRTTGTGINSTGLERCWNVTSVRYPLNYRNFAELKGKPGIKFDDPAPRPAKEGDPAPPIPAYNHDNFGPAHNHPLISGHPGGVQVLMADESVLFLNEALDLGLLLKMCTRNDGYDVNLP
jgi:hypothetical protein